MKLNLPMPAVFQEARKCKPGKNIFLEMLIYVAVYFVSYIVVQTLAEIAFMLIAAVAQGADLTSGSFDFASIGSFIGADAKTLVDLFAALPALLMVLLCCRVVQKRRPFTLGYVTTRMPFEYVRGLIVGFIMMAAVAAVNIVAGGATFQGLTPNLPVATVLLILVGYVVQGLGEETLCRGFFMGSLARGHSLTVAVVVNSVAFSLLHVANTGVTPLAFINLFIMGVCFSVFFLKRGSIWASAA